MNTLKATFGHPNNILSEPLVYESSLIVLSATALDQQLQIRFAVPMVNNCLHAMHAIDLHLHPITNLGHNSAQSNANWFFQRNVSKVF